MDQKIFSAYDFADENKLEKKKQNGKNESKRNKMTDSFYLVEAINALFVVLIVRLT